ncbi:MAG: hypothetical protein JNL02_04635, partial [Saprospiraceae bacterium]|nr:hypothetical protein [Saprospiraceae bacterium]
GDSLFITGNYQPRYNSEEMQLKLLDVKLLSSISGTLTESVTLDIPIELLDDRLLAEIDRVCTEHKGAHTLKMRLLDNTNRNALNFSASKRKVNADSDFAAAMERLGLGCKLN